jgi:urea carboxylase
VSRILEVLSPGLSTTIQDFPGRLVGLGIPRSGPMDALAHCAANILVGNAPGCEALEITLLGPSLKFWTAAVIAVTGGNVRATITDSDGERWDVKMWTGTRIPKGAMLSIGEVGDGKEEGFRCYLAIKEGFPDVPEYLGSKSTSMGLGGYQVSSVLPCNSFLFALSLIFS